MGNTRKQRRAWATCAPPSTSAISYPKVTCGTHSLQAGALLAAWTHSSECEASNSLTTGDKRRSFTVYCIYFLHRCKLWYIFTLILSMWSWYGRPIQRKVLSRSVCLRLSRFFASFSPHLLPAIPSMKHLVQDQIKLHRSWVASGWKNSKDLRVRS